MPRLVKVFRADALTYASVFCRGKAILRLKMLLKSQIQIVALKMRANTFMKPCDNASGAAPYPHLGAVPPFNRFVGKSDCGANVLTYCAVLH
jgi:hypothetical protein